MGTLLVDAGSICVMQKLGSSVPKPLSLTSLSPVYVLNGAVTCVWLSAMTYDVFVGVVLGITYRSITTPPVTHLPTTRGILLSVLALICLRSCCLPDSDCLSDGNVKILAGVSPRPVVMIDLLALITLLRLSTLML